MNIKKGDRVIHRKAKEWGIGEILELGNGPRCRIFFANKGNTLISTDSLDLLEKVEGKSAEHPLLDNLKLSGDKEVKYKTISELITKFINIFPKGFYDDNYYKEERDYKIEAHELMLRLLNKSEYDKMLESEEYEEICSRALKIVNKTNLIFPNEKMALKDGLKSAENKKMFAVSLFQLLYGQSELSERFSIFAETLYSIEAAKWTTQTYFLFITYPDKYIFMKPSVTQSAADAFAFELNYSTEINWNSYEKLMRFSQYVSDELSKSGDALKPRDMIDVQSFIWSSAPGKYIA
ncbi:MAG: DUF3553 domain-containing protein [Syntrophaceae bacterium]|jgi:hypothetical protein|nr:DUF3553 domain-containing protein [Syntrophaceae bacterium]MBP8608605.1 DUF3553 domain-containing protein [Syntrophaceae bacterium]